uniref:Uncharacterized protein n=1 Tax=Candidatus Nitrotoga fabula TaxID=2182327 RepID=A0A2X0RCT6_9PROT|nr:protein of unknown function [Candidatus Nitrotoga fabula]
MTCTLDATDEDWEYLRGFGRENSEVVCYLSPAVGAKNESVAKQVGYFGSLFYRAGAGVSV